MGSLLVYMLILGLVLPIPANIIINVSEAGVAEVYVIFNVNDAPTVIVHKPLGTPFSYYAYYLSTGNPAPLEYNGSLVLGADINGTVVLVYLTEDLTRKEGALWGLNMASQANVAIVLPENTIPLHIEPNPLYVGLNDSRVVVLLPPGNISIEYTLYVASPKTTKPSTSPQPTSTLTHAETASPTKSETSPPPTETAKAPTIGLWLALLAITVGVAVGVLYKLHTRKGSISYILDERDREVINAIKELGGEATASQLLAVLKIPKTSLYRRIKRLLKLGFIEEIKAGGRKIYKLKRET